MLQFALQNRPYCPQAQIKPLIKGAAFGHSDLSDPCVEFCSVALTYSTKDMDVACWLSLTVSFAQKHPRREQNKGVFGESCRWAAERRSKALYSFTQGERVRGLIGSILVDFFNCLDVFFCFIASFYRFCPSIVCGLVFEESKKERAASFVGGSLAAGNAISLATRINPTCVLAWWIPSSSTSSHVAFFDFTATSLSVIALRLA